MYRLCGHPQIFQVQTKVSAIRPVFPNYFSVCYDYEICTANQMTGFYMRATLAFNELNWKKTYYNEAFISSHNHILVTSRSGRPGLFCKKGVLRSFAKFTEKRLCQSLFFNKVVGPRPVTLLKKRLWHRCFLVNFAKFLRTSFLTEHLQWLLLHFKYLKIFKQKLKKKLIKIFLSNYYRSQSAKCEAS